ncbi:hypothetical protein G6F68_017482 [Rhizopus microsporus]|nr:hypothetical protein G6F68_017482 [Rhizopus microsporus]
MSEPRGPIENGTTYSVRPRMAPSNRPLSVSRIWAGSAQLLVGPASSGRSEQMKAVIFLLRAVAPDDAIGLGQRDKTGHPVNQAAMLDVGRHVQRRKAPIQWLIHWGYLHT